MLRARVPSVNVTRARSLCVPRCRRIVAANGARSCVLTRGRRGRTLTRRMCDAGDDRPERALHAATAAEARDGPADGARLGREEGRAGPYGGVSSRRVDAPACAERRAWTLAAGCRGYGRGPRDAAGLRRVVHRAGPAPGRRRCSRPVDRVRVERDGPVARQRPAAASVARVFIVIDCCARRLPAKAASVPSVAELPIAQKTLHACARPVSCTRLFDAAVSVPACKTKTASGRPGRRASRRRSARARTRAGATPAVRNSPPSVGRQQRRRACARPRRRMPRSGRPAPAPRRRRRRGRAVEQRRRKADDRGPRSHAEVAVDDARAGVRHRGRGAEHGEGVGRAAGRRAAAAARRRRASAEQPLVGDGATAVGAAEADAVAISLGRRGRSRSWTARRLAVQRIAIVRRRLTRAEWRTYAAPHGSRHRASG